ncbi:tol-pal system-associated acyl-CoA thioesterase [Hoeflea olei]|uniref:4-hydroxybenzoyl-CoA thioesterase n=1 Tax=Hoeflea olei TaxID=1480615 RepID=A0A1C1Z0L1_9HYPH|nr:tol-pal system-associated acyl-CoA thioesterase [Hoeflea olei]OCW59301.1 4-hydroxybenzoyl-CoA thioesterase [Hoeflea olei]
MTDDMLAGRLDAGGHLLTQRVYYEDTDFSGFVYHARYLHFFERGRTDYIRLLGVSQGVLHAASDPAEQVAFVVRHMEIDFRSPARMDDVLTISTRPAEVRGARMQLKQMILRGDDVLAEAAVTVAVINGFGRARRLPDALLERFLAGAPAREAERD